MPIGAFKLNSIGRYLAPAGRTANSITVVGQTQISTAQSKFGGASAYFDGTGDHLTIPSGSGFNLSGDFTFECWVRYTNSFVSNRTIFNMGTAGSGQPILYTDSAGTLYYYSSGANRITGSNLSLDTWYHVAVSRSGSSTKLFINGTQSGSTYTDSTAISDGTFYIGIYPGDTFGMYGWIDEFRISNIARYTTNFTANTLGPFTNDNNTLLLMHCNGSNGSTTFTDDTTTWSRTAKTLTPTGTTISTTQSKFGGSSMNIAAAGGNGITITGDYTDFVLNTSDFTVEAWIYPTTLGVRTQEIINFYTGTAGSADFVMYVDNSNILSVYTAGTGTMRYNAANVTQNKWYHMAFTKSGGISRLFLDGYQLTQISTAFSTGANGTNEIWIGKGSTSYYTGYLDDVRISRSARYTSGFTPPTSAFVNDSDTLLLVHADGTNGSTSFSDDSTSSGAQPSITVCPNTMTLQANTSSSASTITIPSTAAAGDFAILFDRSTTTTLTVPSGWTQISTTTTTGIRATVSYKTLTSGDPNTTITGMAGTTSKIMLVYRPDQTINSVTVSTPVAQSTTAVPTNQALNMAAEWPANMPLLAFAHYASTGAIATRGSTVTATAEYAVSTTQYVKSFVVNYTTANNSNQTISMSDGGTNSLQSFYIRFR